MWQKWWSEWAWLVEITIPLYMLMLSIIWKNKCSLQLRQLQHLILEFFGKIIFYYKIFCSYVCNKVIFNNSCLQRRYVTSYVSFLLCNI